MTKKTLKRVSKKKQLTKKKSVRKHLSKNLTNQDQATSQNMQNLRQTLTPTPNGKSLRSSLLMGMSNPLFGMAPQQYGNITNEKNIRDAQNKEQTLIEQNNNNKRTIDDLTKRITQLENEEKEDKKTIKDKQHEVDKAQTKRDMAKDNLDESKRQDLKMDKLNNELNNINIQSEEYKRKNEIIKLQTEKDKAGAELHQQKLKHEELQKKFESNRNYQKLQEVKADVELYKAQNAAMEEIMSLPDFLNTNEELIKAMQQREEERMKNELLKEEQKKSMENMKLKAEIASAPDKETVEAMTKEAAEKTKALTNQNLALQNELDQVNEGLDTYDYTKGIYRKARHQFLDTQYEHTVAQQKYTSLNNETNGNLQANVKKSAVKVGQAQAKYDKLALKSQNAHKALQYQVDTAAKEAYNKEMNAPLTEEEKAAYEDLGKNEARSDAMTDLNTATKNNRQAAFNDARMRARIAFNNSPEIQGINNQIIQTETQAIQYQKSTEENELLEKAHRHLQQNQISNQISKNTTEQGMP